MGLPERRLTPEAARARDVGQISAAWSILAQGSTVAAQTLVDLASGGDSEFVRMTASTAILDRTGLGRVEGVVVQGRSGELPWEAAPVEAATGASAATEVLASRMAALAAADILDAEVVPEPETLL